MLILLKSSLTCQQLFAILNEAMKHKRTRSRPSSFGSFTCRYCGEEFLQTNNTHYYCTERCWKDKHNAERREATALVSPLKKRKCKNPDCNNEFTPNKGNHTFCDPKCRIRIRKNLDPSREGYTTDGHYVGSPRKHNCDVCGKEFIKYSSENTMCSSPKCKAIYRRDLYREKNNCELEKVPCPICGDIYDKWKNHCFANKTCGKEVCMEKYQQRKIAHSLETLSDTYVRSQIQSELYRQGTPLTSKDIPQFLVEMKREELLFARKVKEIKKND